MSEPLTEPPAEPEGDDQEAAVGVTPIEELLTEEDYAVMADDDDE